MATGVISPFGALPAVGKVSITGGLPTTADVLDVSDANGGRSGAGQIVQVFDHLNNPIWSIPTAGGPKVYGDNSSAGVGVFGPFISLDGPNTALLWTSQTQRIYAGTGAPAGTLAGGTGDYYFRQDTPAVANQRLYVRTGATTWTGIL